MKPTPKSKVGRVIPNAPSSSLSPAPRTSILSAAQQTNSRIDVLVFGAHPDDIEFGCGGVIARESRAGRQVHFVICSHGEAGSNGTPSERQAEAERSAALLGATVEFIELDGDAHLEIKAVHAIKFAMMLRRLRPSAVLAPSLVENQHPDHWRLGRLVCDAARLARYGGLAEARSLDPHTIDLLLYYAVTPEAEPRDTGAVLIDVSAPEILSAWTAAMKTHASQQKTRDYAALQLARASVNGARCGATAAIPLFPNDPLVFETLASLKRTARRF